MSKFVNEPPEANDGVGSPSHRHARYRRPPDCVIVFDERGHIQHFSPEAERLFGSREADVLDRNVSLLMPSPDRTPGREWPSLDGGHYFTTAERSGAGAERLVI